MSDEQAKGKLDYAFFRHTWRPELFAWEVYIGHEAQPIFIREDRGTNTPGSFKVAMNQYNEFMAKLSEAPR